MTIATGEPLADDNEPRKVNFRTSEYSSGTVFIPRSLPCSFPIVRHSASDNNESVSIETMVTSRPPAVYSEPSSLTVESQADHSQPLLPDAASTPLVDNGGLFIPLHLIPLPEASHTEKSVTSPLVRESEPLDVTPEQRVDESEPLDATSSLPIEESELQERTALTVPPVDKSETLEVGGQSTMEPVEVGEVESGGDRNTLEVSIPSPLRPSSEPVEEEAPAQGELVPLTSVGLAKRLDIGNSTVSRNKNKGPEHFREWSALLAPEGIAWEYRKGDYHAPNFHPLV